MPLTACMINVDEADRAVSGSDSRMAVVDYPELVTRGEAIAEVERRRADDPGASWIASQRDGDWIVVRVGVTPTKVTGTATKPPPAAPQSDPHSAIERAAWFAGGGG